MPSFRSAKRMPYSAPAATRPVRRRLTSVLTPFTQPPVRNVSVRSKSTQSLSKRTARSVTFASRASIPAASPLRPHARPRERHAVQLHFVGGRHVRIAVAQEIRHALGREPAQRDVGAMIEAVQLLDVDVSPHVALIAARELRPGGHELELRERFGDEQPVRLRPACVGRRRRERDVRIEPARDGHAGREAPAGRPPRREFGGASPGRRRIPPCRPAESPGSPCAAAIASSCRASVLRHGVTER